MDGRSVIQQFDLAWDNISMLLLPCHYEFGETLANLPYFYQQATRSSTENIHLLQKQENCLPELVSAKRLQEYLFSGEAEELVEYIDGYSVDNFDTDEVAEEENYLPLWELGDEWLGSL